MVLLGPNHLGFVNVTDGIPITSIPGLPRRAGRVGLVAQSGATASSMLEFAELMCLDAMTREESCGGHFREEHQTADGEAERDDEHFGYVAAWEFAGVGKSPVLHKENLEFDYVHLAQRSYA